MPLLQAGVGALRACALICVGGGLVWAAVNVGVAAIVMPMHSSLTKAILLILWK